MCKLYQKALVLCIVNFNFNVNMSRVSVEWPTDVTKRLIKEYKNRPEMWDLDNTHYSNRQKQQHNLCQLAKLLKKNELDVKNKIRCLRETFFKELSAKRLSQTYTSKWKFYNDLKFIKANCSAKQKYITNHLASRSCSESEDEEADEPTIKLQPESLADEEEDIVLPSPASTQRALDVPLPQPVPETINIDRSKIIPHHQEIPLQERCNRCIASIEECQHFGNFVATEMRDMPLSQRRSFKNEVLRSILHHNPS